jgi:GNAT superfamily N-acetyltransferase
VLSYEDASIELLQGAQLSAANRAYEQLDFAPSSPDDQTFGIFAGDAAIALGRLKHGGDGALELGGFWVKPELRGQGLARRMVEHVLAQVPEGRSVYCIPFIHLAPFYQSFGMHPVEVTPETPGTIRAKLRFCAAQQAAGIYPAACLLRWP